MKIDDVFDYTFETYQKCAHQLILDESVGRDLLIQLIENKDKYSRELDHVLADLIESAGFYPYLLKEGLNISSSAQKIRFENNRSLNIEGKVFHDEQKYLLDLINSNKNVIASAPTSFGKSLLIEEIVASMKYKNILIIQPTLALLDETRKKLSRYLDKYKLIIRTNQKYSYSDKGNIFLLTSERVNEYESFPEIDFLIVDEFYKFSSKRDDERHQSLNNAFIKIFKRSAPRFYFLGPNIDGITPGFSEKFNAVFYESQYSLVRCNSFNIYEDYDGLFGNLGNKAKFKEKILFELLAERSDEQSIIYCASPAKARKLSKNYSSFISKNSLAAKYSNLPLIEWIEKNISTSWSLIDSLRLGVAFHDGALPRHITSSIIDYFNDGLINVLFCTSTIIEGVNTSAKNIVYFDNKKGDSLDIDYFDYSNIKGRAGRLMQHYSGNVFNFNPPPEKEAIYIDIPFFEQNPINEEILINLDSDEIQDKNSEGYNFIVSLPYEELLLLKKNSINIRGQKKLLDYLKLNMHKIHSLLSWNTTPKYQQLEFCIQLCWDFLLKENEKNNQMSARRLTKVTFDYGLSQNIIKLVKSMYDYKLAQAKNLNADKKNKLLDDSIKDAFYILRHWFQYKLPKLLSVLNELQSYICNIYGLAPGNYSYYSSIIENDFIPEHLNILIEYGIPKSAIDKISKFIPNTLTDDSVIQLIKKEKLYNNNKLIDYEKNIIMKNIII
ncbi:helicase [Klebsiella variicola]|uniref:DEAD/DEAH box helicase n=1 Tax=Klebsiella variicola TaxID=244366 RepID=UPI000D743CC6|nr:DEAD/DEAH box helicase [Klebsiella variicola]PXK71845.1 helicase [Klebsiella variicola]SXG01554.1 helicase [Klebsiella variicola]